MKQLYYLVPFFLLLNISKSHSQDYDAKLIELYFANDSDPESFIEAASGFYFTAVDPVYGRELWFSDGTIENTRMIKDIAQGDASSGVQTLAVLGDKVLFLATANWFSSDPKLWISDGTEEGTMEIKDIKVQKMFTYKGRAYFQATTDGEGAELWVTDGTRDGTKVFKDIREGGESSYPVSFFEFNGSLFFLADDGLTGRELWKSDGTPEGTQILKDIHPRYGSLNFGNEFLQYNGNFFFMADGEKGVELYKSNGTKEGTVMVKDINPNGNAAQVLSGAVTDEGIFFPAFDNVNGFELWKSDGTEKGTLMVKNISLGGSALASHSTGGSFASLGTTVFFAARDDVNGTELWKTDGTEEGTLMVKEIIPGNNYAGIQYLQNMHGQIYFVAPSDNSFEVKLWITDGTESGTVILHQVNLKPNYSSFQFELFPFRDQLFFDANSDVYGNELWVTDGTGAGTRLFKDFNHRWGSGAQNFLDINGLLYFAARHNTSGNQLFVSNGTREGTKMVKTINPSGYNSLTEHSEAVSLNGKLLFDANDGVHGFELWKSDGTKGGTMILKDINKGSKSSMYDRSHYSVPTFSVIGDKLFFAADDGVHGFELWITDGTSEGTKMVKDINAGASSSVPGEVVSLNGTVYFTAKDQSGTALWKTDGTPGGTVKIKNLNWISQMRVVNNRLIIIAETSNTTYGPHDLWSSDGTAAGTVHLKSFGDGIDSDIRFMTILNDEVYFVAKSPDSHEKAIFKTNGTAEGTKVLYDGVNTSGDLDIDVITTCGDYVYFLLDFDYIYGGGPELWRTGGEPETTERLSDTPEGVFKSFYSLTCFQDDFYFKDDYSSSDIWKVEEASGATARVSYKVDGKAPSEEMVIHNMIGSKNVLYFVASKPETGDELYAIQNGELASLPVDQVPEKISTDIFTIKVGDETCAGKENGSLFIESSKEFSFTANVNGKNFNFSKTLEVQNLLPGDYSVCITTNSGPSFRQCFEFSIEPGIAMEGKIQTKNFSGGTLVNVRIAKGNGPFLATLDGKTIGSFDSHYFSLFVNEKGKLEISPGNLCEGKLSMDLRQDEIVAFPNPTHSFLQIAVPDTQLEEIPVSVYNESGQLISSGIYKVANNTIVIDVQRYSTGLFYAVLRLSTPRTVKFSKK